MLEPVNAWKKDSAGYFIELEVGAARDYSINWAEYWPAGTLASAVWSVPAGVSSQDEIIADKLTQARLGGVQAGVHPCSLTTTVGLESKVFPFRVVVT